MEGVPVNNFDRGGTRDEPVSEENVSGKGRNGWRSPNTALNEPTQEVFSARLEQMRKQVLSKEFWMSDDICKECFLCTDPFTAFRRKHHCRTCGCIFDSKCTSIISGERFGVQGTLRVCKTCLDIINRRHDSSGSDESADDAILPSTIFHSHQARLDFSHATGPKSPAETAKGSEGNAITPTATPMMAIPATRRLGDSLNSRSAVLEIDSPHLSRPSSSRSLKTLALSRPSSRHRRHQSKHNFLGRFRAANDGRAPFHIAEQTKGRSRLPTFHDDNIIDPDLAQYMSDDGSSGDEQVSISNALNGNNDMISSAGDERMTVGSLLANNRKYRSRPGEKSINGSSQANRHMDEITPIGSISAHARPGRRRNLSTSSSTFHHVKGSPRQGKGSNTARFGSFGEDMQDYTGSPPGSADVKLPLKMTRSVSMRDAKAPAIELNHASLHHVRQLLRQLLQDASIPNTGSWEKALIPILLQCTDDVNPDIRRGDDIDIRHYVKLKKIPGGKPGDTAYVSGVVFTKNVALKSMTRHISYPRIVIISFPIEYQRHQQHFMSLEPVIAQEKDFLKNMVNRIASLRPHLVLVQKNISGLALQYLADANIAVAYNVKQSVIEAVSRFAQTEIISSIDMVALKPVHVGKSAGFDVKTYVHNDIQGKKKTCIYVSGCPKELGCTIVLRGAGLPILAKMKRITEFMVYVVYNLKLETCLMRDEFVLIPSIKNDLKSPTQDTTQGILVASSETPSTDRKPDSDIPASKNVHEIADGSKISKGVITEASDGDNMTDVRPFSGDETDKLPMVEKTSNSSKFISVHESHVHGAHEVSVPEDVPMPTFYSDMVAKHETKILSASPFVKFMQPYLLMKARQQERRLVYLKRLRDQDTFEDQTDVEKSKPLRFQLIKPEMVHETLRGAPRQIMEVLHAVHDAEYDKALHNYQTQKRQWENYIQGNLNLFDPYAHQNIVVLYTVVCTATTIPCAGPELLALAFYNEHEVSAEFDPDCTLGQYVEELCLTVNTVCTSNGCERKMSEHHRTYVHGEARITIFVERSPSKINGLQDSILMWSYCKICKKETQVMPMSESTWKYSFGKYLELSFWSSNLRLRAGFCPHDLHRDHLRYFGYRDVAIRIHYDPIDLLEIVVPRARITWKVNNDLRLKNDLFTKSEERWNRFMTSVKSRIRGINIDSVLHEKAEACKAEIEQLTRRANEEHTALIRKLQDKYMESKYYEIIPLNRAVRAMQEKVAEWDAAFADFDNNFFPSEKDIRRLAAVQLRRMFMDRDVSSVINQAEPAENSSDVEEKSEIEGHSLASRPSDNVGDAAQNVLQSVIEEEIGPNARVSISHPNLLGDAPGLSTTLDISQERVDHLDLAIPWEPHNNLDPLSTMSPKDDTTIPNSEMDNEDTLSSMQSGNSILLQEDASLSEKIQHLRKAGQTASGELCTESAIPRPSGRKVTRANGNTVSPPLGRTQSQPAGALRKLPVSTSNSILSKADSKSPRSQAPDGLDVPKTVGVEPPKDKKLSERLGLNTLKMGRKAGQSLIPRSVQTKRKESKVSTLAKHFEQLSREFEKERLRDRKQRAAKVTQSRAFPKASSKPIVEVYKDVNEAVQERGPSDDDLRIAEVNHSSLDHISTAEGLASLNTEGSSLASHSSQIPTNAGEEHAAEAEDDNQPNASQTGSDEDDAVSDVDHSLLDDIPGVAEIAATLGAAEPNADLELPKHEKSSVMKVLSNFWAERSASGWTQLEYPLNATDHVFVDSDVIVREDEPSSLIAFALSSEDYIAKLDNVRKQGQEVNEQSKTRNRSSKTGDLCDDGIDQAAVEMSLLKATGTHLKYQFVEGSAKMLCKIFYAEQFDAVRRKCGAADRIVESLSRCLKWDSKGGKTKSVFLKTLDDRFVLKSLSPIETQAFLRFAPAYFEIMAEALFHDLPTVIAKMLGFYQIIIKNPVTGTEIKWDVLVMENLFYDRSPTRIFDLKGSMRNRKIQSTGEQNEVLLDENMVEFIYESPLFAREHSKKLLRASVWNDTLFLAKQNVMDYSLMVAVDESRQELVVGIIDCIRTYTWDKKLESWIKDRGFAGGGRNRPTVTSPKEYKSRFREAMARYVLQAPNCWHHFATQHVENGSVKGNE